MLTGGFEDKIQFLAESDAADVKLKGRKKLGGWNGKRTCRSGRERPCCKRSPDSISLSVRQMSGSSLSDSRSTHTSAWGNRTLAPYTAPLRAALRMAK